MASDRLHLGEHISQQFNADLEDVRNHVMTMGGVVEEQISAALRALIEGDSELGEAVVRNDHAVNDHEVSIDEECQRILARRQPAASDLRLVVAIIKTITDLERIGDEAEKIGRMSAELASMERPSGGYQELENLGRMVQAMVHDTLDAFARLDTEVALDIAKADERVDREYEAILRQCMTFMMEDPRTIRRVMDLIWVARALERIGDHAKNIGEYVIYLVKGKDVRHLDLDEMVQEIQGDED